MYILSKHKNIQMGIHNCPNSNTASARENARKAAKIQRLWGCRLPDQPPRTPMDRRSHQRSVRRSRHSYHSLQTSYHSAITVITHKPVVFLAGAIGADRAMLTTHLHTGGQIIMGRRTSDTRTMRREIYYVHPQSGRARQVAVGRPAASAVCSGENPGLQNWVFKNLSFLGF